MARLDGKRCLVTGGANGIGRAIAEAFAAEGGDVFITSRADPAAAGAVCAGIAARGRQTGFLVMEAQTPDAVDSLFAAAEACLGPIDVLVNNAATAARTPFLEMGEAEYDRTMTVNLRFPFFTTQRFARTCVADGRPGSVINVASVSAAKAISRLSAYQCSKAGLVMLTRGAAYELAPWGVRVNTLSPGLTATKGNADQWRDNPALWRERGRDLPLGRAGTPADMAGAAVFLACDESAWMTGGEIVVDGGDSVI